ncbi:MAG: hypothetical protein M1114_03925 [Candidatus Dependentiae bacterium]|nr:hypothetical protein [Candidatus Dependentiae bacterium]
MPRKLDVIDALCDILDRNKALKHYDAQALKKAFRERTDLIFEDFLLEEGIVDKEDLLNALAEYYQVPAIDAMGILFDHHLVTMFPKDVMLRNLFIPYDREEDVLLVIAVHPQDPDLPELIGKFVSYDVTFLVGLARDISDSVKEFYDESLLQRSLDQTMVDEVGEQEEELAEVDKISELPAEDLED